MISWIGSMADWLASFASVAVVSAIIGAITSFLVSGRSVYINSITSERSKWIDRLRNNIALYSAANSQLALRLLNSEPEHKMKMVAEKLEEINQIASTIQLQLNPWGEIDRNVLAMVEGFVVRERTPIGLIQAGDDLLIRHSQWLLKAEWEKVKYEASGPIRRIAIRAKAWGRIRRYRTWCKGEGNLQDVLKAFLVEKQRAPEVTS